MKLIQISTSKPPSSVQPISSIGTSKLKPHDPPTRSQNPPSQSHPHPSVLYKSLSISLSIDEKADIRRRAGVEMVFVEEDFRLGRSQFGGNVWGEEMRGDFRLVVLGCWDGKGVFCSCWSPKGWALVEVEEWPLLY